MLWFVAIVGSIFFLASLGRKAKQRAAVEGLRRNFPPIALARLASAFPGIEDHLTEDQLRPVFDWILSQMHARTNTRSFGDLMAWSVANSEKTEDLTMAVAHDSVARLPPQVLKLIGDDVRLAAVYMKLALDEAGQKVQRELDRTHV